MTRGEFLRRILGGVFAAAGLGWATRPRWRAVNDARMREHPARVLFVGGPLHGKVRQVADARSVQMINIPCMVDCGASAFDPESIATPPRFEQATYHRLSGITPQQARGVDADLVFIHEAPERALAIARAEARRASEAYHVTFPYHRTAFKVRA